VKELRADKEKDRKLASNIYIVKTLQKSKNLL